MGVCLGVVGVNGADIETVEREGCRLWIGRPSELQVKEGLSRDQSIPPAAGGGERGAGGRTLTTVAS